MTSRYNQQFHPYDLHCNAEVQLRHIPGLGHVPQELNGAWGTVMTGNRLWIGVQTSAPFHQVISVKPQEIAVMRHEGWERTHDSCPACTKAPRLLFRSTVPGDVWRCIACLAVPRGRRIGQDGLLVVVEQAGVPVPWGWDAHGARWVRYGDLPPAVFARWNRVPAPVAQT